jgi:hypothetical protein
MLDWLYRAPSGVLVAGLVAAGILALELGARAGLGRAPRAADAVRSQVTTLSGSLIALLGLVLGFTLSVSLQRHAELGSVLVAEANAMATAHLRADVLAPPLRERARDTLARYVDHRVASARTPLVDHAERALEAHETAHLHERLWSLVREAQALDPNASTSGLFMVSVNELMAACRTREAALERRVPAGLFVLVFVAFVFSSAFVGYASGVGGVRPSAVAYAQCLLVGALFFVIVELDRPRRGTFRVHHESLEEVRASLRAPRG